MKEGIFQRLIAKGRLHGQVAHLFARDEIKGNQFITECFEQCHTNSAFDHWGANLIMDIIKYRLDLLRKPLRDLIQQSSAHENKFT